MSTQEHVILLSAQGEIIGIQEKYAAHTAHTPQASGLFVLAV
jgi:isopentenyl-diphosphate delta-isomerase